MAKNDYDVTSKAVLEIKQMRSKIDLLLKLHSNLVLEVIQPSKNNIGW